jgi:hypothetical protein
MRALRKEFYFKMWRSAADATGARFTCLDGDNAVIERDGRQLQVNENTTSLDNRMTLERAGNKGHRGSLMTFPALFAQQFLRGATSSIRRHRTLENYAVKISRPS